MQYSTIMRSYTLSTSWKVYTITCNVIFVISFLHFRVFLKDFLYAVGECYDIIFPWLNLLEDTQKVTITLFITGSSSQCLIPASKLWPNLECC